MSKVTEMVVDGHSLRLTNLEKVLYPEAEFTKAALLDYYVRVTPFLLPHLKNRPLTLRRFPDGVTGPAFYAKNCPSYRPSWMKTAEVWSQTRQATTEFCVVNDLPSLVWVANLAAIELHPSLSLAQSRERPTAVAFDLDPGAPAGVLECAQVALTLKGLFDTFELQAFPKTSGSKGLQVYVPLNTPVTYAEAKQFALEVAELLESQFPKLVVSNMKKALRVGKVFVDWSQNDLHKTTVAVYSLRARDRPTASTPVTWEEIERAVEESDADALRFDASQVLKRVGTLGDLFAPVATLKQRLPAIH